jgi:phytoene desaturase
MTDKLIGKSLGSRNVSKRVVVIGAGPGGLASAMLLAKAGLKVQVLERQPRAGGRTAALEAQGFRFDLGPTFFLYPQVLERIFSAVGRNLHEEVELVRLDPHYKLWFGSGAELVVTPDLARMERAIAAISPRDAGSLRRFLADNRHKFARFAPCTENPFLSWHALLSRRLLALLPFVRPWLSLDEELARYFRDPRVRLAFTFQAKYLGMSPFKCPGLFSILSYLEHEHGVYHPIGGCAALTEAMVRVAADLGVEILLGQDVQEILFEGRRAVGVRTQTETFRADALVINADFARAMTRLVPDRLRRRWTNQRIARKQFSCSTFMLYLGIEGRYDGLPHHTIYLPAEYERNLDDIDTRHVLSNDPAFYVQNACVTDPGLAPPGMSTLYVLVPVTHAHPNVDWRVERDRFGALVLRQLGRIGLLDVAPRIRFARVVTPDDWDKQLQIHLGSTFNLAHSFRQMLHLRPHNRFEDLDGVYIVGGGTHPGSGLPVIFESARISTRLLLEDFGLPAHRGADPPEEPDPLCSVEPTRELATALARNDPAFASLGLHEELLS